MKSDGKGTGRLPIRVWVGAKRTVRLREYESASVEMAVEVDAGTPRKEIEAAVKDADLMYAVMNERVAARAFEAKVQAAAEDRKGGRTTQTNRLAVKSVLDGEWTSRPAPPGSRGSKVGRK